jgi:hypothetical protein
MEFFSLTTLIGTVLPPIKTKYLDRETYPDVPDQWRPLAMARIESATEWTRRDVNETPKPQYFKRLCLWVEFSGWLRARFLTHCSVGQLVAVYGSLESWMEKTTHLRRKKSNLKELTVVRRREPRYFLRAQRLGIFNSRGLSSILRQDYELVPKRLFGELCRKAQVDPDLYRLNHDDADDLIESAPYDAVAFRHRFRTDRRRVIGGCHRNYEERVDKKGRLHYDVDPDLIDVSSGHPRWKTMPEYDPEPEPTLETEPAGPQPDQPPCATPPTSAPSD